jgi:hypothetical protein
MILGQQAGHSLEVPEIQSENCLHGRESPGSKELKRVNLNILPNSVFGCPAHDLHGFSLPLVVVCAYLALQFATDRLAELLAGYRG